MTEIPESRQRVKFYQTGTLTVGNRLLDESQRTVQATLERANAITSGHRACQGCSSQLVLQEVNEEPSDVIFARP